MQTKNAFFDLTTYRKTVTRFWPLWAMYLAAWIILLPLQGLTDLRQDAAATGEHLFTQMENFANGTVPDMRSVALALAAVFGVLAAMAVFSHLYSARSANLFGSLPIRREGLFLTHYLAGLSFLLVPNVIVFLLTLLVEAAGGCVVMKGLLFWLGVNCGECFFFYSMAVFCAMFTGHLLALPAFYGIFNFLILGVSDLLYAVMMEFYYGFAGFGSRVSEAVTWLTPFMCLGRKVQNWWSFAYETDPNGEEILSAERVLETEGGMVVGIYVLAAVVLTVCAFFLYRARRLESAGDVVSVKPMKPVFKYGLAICVGLAFGYYTHYVMDSGNVGLGVSIVIWGIVGYFAGQMLLDKSFRVFRKWKGALAVTGVFAVMFVVVGLDLTGFVNRVPDTASIKEIHIDGLSAVNWDDNGDWVSLDVSDPEHIELLTALHQAAINDRDRVWNGTTSLYPMLSTRVELTYTLNNGTTMSRRYYLDLDPDLVNEQGSFSWAVETLYQDRDFYWRGYGFDRLEQSIAEGKRLESVEFTNYIRSGGESFVLGYGSDARALLDAVEEDFRAGRIGVRTITDTSYYEYGHRYTNSLNFRVVDPEDGDVWMWLQIAIQDTASSTQAEVMRLAEKLEDNIWRRTVEEWQMEIQERLQEAAQDKRSDV